MIVKFYAGCSPDIRKFKIISVMQKISLLMQTLKPKILSNATTSLPATKTLGTLVSFSGSAEVGVDGIS